ncbi:MAG: tRNA glutamyl-Q(34) synthetase GluQRS [Stagnimonas sp.]|nr:tRNA glutamyl-Q(34) synthetase GluQRS [Stagnimonas sp.]
MNLPPRPEPPSGYRGRFAPTPSGPLHLGSLLTALASWLDARAAQGRWLLRIDDLDRARCPPGASDLILRQLEAHGLYWDESPRWQSEHVEEYQQAFAELERRGHTYACYCTRALLAVESRAGPDGPVYSGRCRLIGARPEAVAASSRLRLEPEALELVDPIQGTLRRHSTRDIGDFVLRRADGVIGYQLACVLDEAAQGITEVLRGADLIGSSFRQRLLQRELGLRSPGYAHLPVLTGADGRKLSKQNGAAALDPDQPASNLRHCLQLLGQAEPEPGLPVEQLLLGASQRWLRSSVPPRVALQAAS